MTSTTQEQHDISDYGKQLWDYLTGKDATISYTFQDMQVEVPSRTGEGSPRATWRISGNVKITTSDADGTS